MFKKIFVIIPILIILIVNFRLFKFYKLDYIHFNNTFEYYDFLQFGCSNVLNKNEVFNFLTEDFNYNKFNVSHIDNLEALGYWNPISKKINIKNNLDGLNYTYTLTHELIHNKYNTVNERFVTYKTIIYLYENENSYFKYISSMCIKQIFATNILPYHSDCKWYINEYFKQL